MRSGVTRDCLNCMGKVPVDRERLTMVVIIGRIVQETSFRRNVGIGSRSHCLLGEACKRIFAVGFPNLQYIAKIAVNQIQKKINQIWRVAMQQNLTYWNLTI